MIVCMDIEINTQNCILRTDNAELIKALYELYSFKVQGYQYSSAYKSHRWDGTKRFFSRKGVFKTGMLTRVLSDLKKVDCYPTLIDKRTVNSNHLDCQLNNITYYPYQEETIEKCLQEKRLVVKAPTGAGKTLIIGGIVKALRDRKMVILFNAKQLLNQTYEFLTDVCNLDNIGLCFGEGYIYGDIMLCTVQSIDKILDTHLNDTEALLVDECHEFCNGKTTLAAIESFPNANFRFGFTATTPNKNIPKFNLEGALGQTHSVVTTSDLVDDGKLTKPVIQLIDRDYSASGADEDMSYLEVYEEYIVKNEERNNTIKEIVDDIRQKNKRARILILTKSLDHGRTLENLLGVECSSFLEGADSLSERCQAISRFRGCRDSSVLIGTKILQTGINIEEITHFINARAMKSEIATLQALGRALRKHETKTQVFVYDFLDKEKYLGTHALERKRHYKKENHEVVII